MALLKFKDLSEIYQDRIKIWVSKGGFKYETTPETSLKWVVDEHENIYKFIMNHKTNNKEYSGNTKRSFISLLALILKAFHETQLYDKYSKIHKKLSDELLNIENKQQLTGNEINNWVSRDEIFKKILELRKIFERDNTISSHYYYLALCMYYYTPPIRNNYYDMLVINKIHEANDEKQNYILSTDSSYKLIINVDKMSNFKGSDIISIDSVELNQIIKDSLKSLPRKYLFTNLTDINKPMNEFLFIKRLKDIFKNENKEVSINILRSSYVTWFYEHNKSIIDRNLLASKMRHSRDIAERTYLKIPNKETDKKIGSTAKLFNNFYKDKESNNVDKVVKVDKTDNVDKVVKVDKTDKTDKTDIIIGSKEYYQKASKKYYDDNKYTITRAKLIKNLNSQSTKKPSKNSIEKYKLIFDNTLNLWK